MVTDLDGNFLVQIGSTGEEGFRDGNFNEAAFNRPQVMVPVNQIYISVFVWTCQMYIVPKYLLLFGADVSLDFLLLIYLNFQGSCLQPQEKPPVCC